MEHPQIEFLSYERTGIAEYTYKQIGTEIKDGIVQLTDKMALSISTKGASSVTVYSLQDGDNEAHGLYLIFTQTDLNGFAWSWDVDKAFPDGFEGIILAVAAGENGGRRLSEIQRVSYSGKSGK